MQKQKIVVVVLGGVVTDVFCDTDADVELIDFDNLRECDPAEADAADKRVAECRETMKEVL